MEPDILILSDSSKLRKILADRLAARGYAISVVRTGGAALKKVEEEAPHVALIDLGLKDMSGPEVVSEIGRRSPTTECIVLAKRASHPSIIEAMKLGAYGFLLKPYDAKQLEVTIGRAMEKREADEALREREEELQILLASLTEGLLILDSDLAVVTCNDFGARILGINQEDLIGKNIEEISPDIMSTGHLERFRNVLRAGRALALEDFVLPGQAGDIHVSLRVFKVGSGLGVTVTDITEQRRVEEELRHANREVSRLMASISDSLWSAELDNKGHMACRYYSPVIERITGRPPDFYMAGPHRWLSIVHPDDLSKVEQAMTRALFDTAYRVLEEYRIILPDETVRWVRDSIMITETGGSPRRLDGVLTDITEFRKAMADLEAERASLAQRVAERTMELREANVELARAARLKDEFLANMSHELRTPLNTVLGMSEALREEAYGALNEKQQESLEQIEESGRHLLALINDILDVSKVEAGKVELEIGPVSLESVCQASLWLIKQIAFKRRLRVRSRIDSRGIEIQADERRLKQVLVNLLSNAVKFTPKGGEIGLDVEGDVEGGAIRFTVWDTGIGISEEAMGLLFTPFVQLDSRLSRKYEGTGLGLALVHRLTALHGGSVRLESTVGEGSRFTVSLPWDSKDREEEEDRPCGGQVAVVVKAGGTMRIMEMITDQLEGIGYRVVVAEDPSEAAARDEDVQPDVMVINMEMPSQEGLEIVRRFCGADSKTRDIPLVVLTSLDIPGDRERFIDAGADEYLIKPVGARALARVLGEWGGGDGEESRICQSRI